MPVSETAGNDKAPDRSGASDVPELASASSLRPQYPQVLQRGGVAT